MPGGVRDAAGELGSRPAQLGRPIRIPGEGQDLGDAGQVVTASSHVDRDVGERGIDQFDGPLRPAHPRQDGPGTDQLAEPVVPVQGTGDARRHLRQRLRPGRQFRREGIVTAHVPHLRQGHGRPGQRCELRHRRVVQDGEVPGLKAGSGDRLRDADGPAQQGDDVSFPSFPHARQHPGRADQQADLILRARHGDRRCPPGRVEHHLAGRRGVAVLQQGFADRHQLVHPLPGVGMRLREGEGPAGLAQGGPEGDQLVGDVDRSAQDHVAAVRQSHRRPEIVASGIAEQAEGIVDLRQCRRVRTRRMPQPLVACPVGGQGAQAVRVTEPAQQVRVTGQGVLGRLGGPALPPPAVDEAVQALSALREDGRGQAREGALLELAVGEEVRGVRRGVVRAVPGRTPAEGAADRAPEHPPHVVRLHARQVGEIAGVQTAARGGEQPGDVAPQLPAVAARPAVQQCRQAALGFLPYDLGRR